MGDEIFERLKQEKEFHDGWANDMDIATLDPDAFYRCPTTPEVTYGIDSLGDVRTKRIVCLGIGSGISSVFFALKGAEVIAADISPGMCALADELARRFRVSPHIRTSVMAGGFLAVRDESCDLFFGENVLHHLDLDLAVPEIRRILKKGGTAVFVEPLGHNPFINLFRRLSPQTRTESERPLLMKDVRRMAGLFSQCRHTEFHLLTLSLYVWFYFIEGADPNKERFWIKIVNQADRYEKAFQVLYALDRILLAGIPFLKRHCRMSVIRCEK